MPISVTFFAVTLETDQCHYAEHLGGKMTKHNVQTAVRIAVAAHELVFDDLIFPVASLLSHHLLAVSRHKKISYR